MAEQSCREAGVEIPPDDGTNPIVLTIPTGMAVPELIFRESDYELMRALIAERDAIHPPSLEGTP